MPLRAEARTRVNRAAAMTCGVAINSHDKEIAPGSMADLAQLRQIDESGAMSNLLLDRFLPFASSHEDCRRHPVPGPNRGGPTAPVQAAALHRNCGAVTALSKGRTERLARRQRLSDQIRRRTNPSRVRSSLPQADDRADCRRASTRAHHASPESGFSAFASSLPRCGNRAIRRVGGVAADADAAEQVACRPGSGRRRHRHRPAAIVLTR